jgi:hypothetical protein
MEIEFDPAKDQANIAKHGVSLARAADLEILSVELDERKDYGERRYIAFGRIGDLTYCLVFTLRGSTLRAISLRRAHLEEFDAHVSEP